MFSYFESTFIGKFFRESDFSSLDKIEMTRNKNRSFGRHFQTVQHFNFFPELWFLIVHTLLYGANFIAKFWWKSGFLRVFHGTPLGHQGEYKYLGHLSVNSHCTFSES